MQDAVIVSAVRTAVGRGKKDGSLAGVHPIDLSAIVLQEAIKRADLDPRTIDDVIWGCAMPEGAQGLNVARLAVLRARLPVDVPAVTVNRFCSSGLQTIAMGAQAIMSGMADVIVAGGVEMMSQVPMSGYHARLHHGMTEEMIAMGLTAERVAKRWSVSRVDQDQYAYESHAKAARALERGAFTDQIVPVPVERVTWRGTKKEVEEGYFAVDELVRTDTSAERLAKLPAAFMMGGSVTAGNASPYSDGAAAVALMSESRARTLGLRPLARLAGYAVAGVDPDIMGVGPIKAVPKALAKAGIGVEQLALIEFNEAFASQALAVARDLQFPMDRVNVNGGAIALGHPLGATGAKLTTQLVHELGTRGGGYGLVTMCIGGGMGAAGVFEVFPA
ncbi:MAG: thiolase family protein [Gemmatimonadetes bacterium]|jgi:acetyl-CoA acyltransferase|nr:thiolase family protein [Gemmatimonadota bacterium]MBK7836006.1 thiolase family protein [Gemmatimonadota bacterium]MBK9407815.1 thiolase family protein [Gemmatimonadota bacterium]MBK9979164.1 thiolase family protein [Gemmatimonadota bacterium]